MLNWLRKFSRAGRAEEQSGAAERHYELGRSMRGMGELARAVTCFRKAIETDPRHLDARIDLASVLLALGAPDLAEEATRGALAVDARSIAALVNLGAALAGQGKLAEGAASYRQALAIDPHSVPALANLSAACLQLGALEEARQSAQAALSLSPGDADAHIRLGNVQMEQRLPGLAAASFREAIRLRPDSPAGYNALGFAQDMQGDLAGAMRAYDQALALAPEDVQARVSRASNWLLEEDYARGWEEYAWRKRSPAHAPLFERFALPPWDEAPLAGRRLLVYAEQGLGDELLFASCLPDVIAQAAHVVVDCEPRLEKLFRRSFPAATVRGNRQTDATAWVANVGAIDFAVPAGDLPRHFRRGPDSFPPQEGYLHADPAAVARWRARLDALGPGRKIGLSWRGGVPQTGRGLRSLTLEELLPVLRTPDVRFVNLQYGDAARELEAFGRRHGIAIQHWQEALDDYDETAALVCALDLTLSVCTALADLGGALGRPVWVMAPVRSDFRYGLRGERLRWYPSVRVFRQAKSAEWAPVLDAVAEALQM